MEYGVRVSSRTSQDLIAETPNLDSPVIDIDRNQTFVTSTIDSADTTKNKRTKINLDGKVNFVKKQR